MISATFLWGNVLLKGALQKDAKNPQILKILRVLSRRYEIRDYASY